MNALVRRVRGEYRTAAVRELPTGEIAISKSQRNVHVVFEALAIPFAGVLAYIAYNNKTLPPWQRNVLYAGAVATVIVDGGLLISYSRKKQ